MQLSEAVRQRIKFYMKKNDMSMWKLFQMSGVPMSTLSTFLSGKTDLIKLYTLLHICEGLGITLYEFFSDETFNTAEHD